MVAVSDVGRAAACALLADVLRGMLDRSSAAVVEIVGEPGIGKTTMLEALAADAAGAGCLVLHGRAAEFERDVPFGVIVDAIDVHFGCSPTAGAIRSTSNSSRGQRTMRRPTRWRGSRTSVPMTR